MAATLPTLLDLARLDAGVGYNLINEAVKSMRPELEIIPADTISGVSVTLSVLAALPTVAFRNYNEGVARSKARFEHRIFQCGIIDQQIAVDKSLANSSKDKGRFLEAQSMPLLEAALDHVCSQFWYGVSNDAKGFVGLIAQHETAATHNYDRGGNSAKSSVWFFELGREKLDWLWGEDRPVYMDGEWRDETVYDDNNRPMPALVNWLHGRPAVRLANKNKAVRIKNIEEDTNKLTDAIMYGGYELAQKLAMKPNAIFMNPRSLEQLRSARTATNATGAPAPLPRDWEGIPIYVTTAITEAETI